MNKAEMLAIMISIHVAYPAYYRNVPQADVDMAVSLWTEQFSEYPASLVTAAVKALIAADEKGFPPHIGAVMAKIRLLTQERGTTEQEAWAIVAKAVRGASMGAETRIYRNGELDRRTSAERKFDEMPKIMRRLVGSPDQLAMWALLPEDELQTVIASNFQRSYRAAIAEEQDLARLPEDVKRLVAAREQKQLKAGL